MPVFPPIIAFFTHPMMLLWALAAAAPLIIHLLNKRKHREVPWAAVEYLLAAMRNSARRIRIEQWLLLALRTLLILLIVLAVAEPYLNDVGLTLVSGQRTHKVLILDGSFSMDYRPTDKSRFDRAQELAAQIVNESPQGDGFTLVLMSDPPSVVVGTPAFEPNDFIEEIDNLRLPHAGGDLAATLEKVEGILDSARREQPRLVREEVYFLTDLGRQTWLPDFAGAAAAAKFRERSARLGERTAAMVVIDLGQAGSENLAVTDLRTSESLATIARDVQFEAVVRSFALQPRARQLVELVVDGRRAGEQYVDLEPGGSASVSFSYKFDAPGEHAVQARLAADLLDVDNHRFLSLPVRETIRVLCINGKPSDGQSAAATDYLAVALSPESRDAGRPLVMPDVAPETALLEYDLDQYECIFLANVGQFTPSEARVLDAYLAGGGGLVFFLGDQVVADSYNQYLTGQGPPGARVLPAMLGDPVQDSNYRFDPLDYAHRIVNVFKGRETAGLLTTPVYRYFRLLVPEDSAAQVALAFDTGDPAIVEERLRGGRSILVATSAADRAWSELPMWSSFVPIVQELLALAVTGRLEERNVQVGEPLSGALRRAATGSPVGVRVSDATSSATGGSATDGEPAPADPVRTSEDGDLGRWSYAGTWQSGVYEAEFQSPVARRQLYAVNVDTAESDLTKLDPAELADLVWTDVDYVHRTNWQDLDEQPEAEITGRSTIHRSILTGVLVLLFAETYLAWHLGRRTR